MALLEEVVAEMGAEEARSAGDNRCRHNRASVLTGPDRSPSSLRTFFIPARPRSSDVAAAHSGLELPRGSDRRLLTERSGPIPTLFRLNRSCGRSIGDQTD